MFNTASGSQTLNKMGPRTESCGTPHDLRAEEVQKLSKRL